MKERCDDYQYLRWEEHGKQTARYTMCQVEASLFLGHIHNRTNPHSGTKWMLRRGLRFRRLSEGRAVRGLAQ